MEFKFLSHTLQHLERVNILRIVDFFKSKSININTIIHDGFLIKKEDEEGFEEKIIETIQECQEYMIEKFKIKFNLEIKPFIEHKFLEPPENLEATESKETPYKYLCNKLLNFAMEENLRKDEYRVYKRSNKNPMVYELYCDDLKILLEIVFKK